MKNNSVRERNEKIKKKFGSEIVGKIQILDIKLLAGKVNLRIADFRYLNKRNFTIIEKQIA